MRYVFMLLCLIGVPCIGCSAVYLVGPDGTYAAPSEVMSLVSDGDTVFIQAGEYLGDVGVWNANNLLIRGVGGLAHLRAQGNSAQGKAIWVINGDNTTIEFIEFSEAAVLDENGAGIRHQGGDLTLRHCYFHNNENGILAGDLPGVTITIEYCEFADNGFGDGLTHNIYVNHIETFILRFSYVHHAIVGHNVKSRAQNNVIQYNRIMDESTGNASYLIDIPNGGNTHILGNLLMQGPLAQNSTLVSYGAEGYTNTNHHLFLYNNSMVNERFNSTFLNAWPGYTTAKMFNNILAGAGTIVLGTSDTVANLYYANPELAGFIDYQNYDYDLTSTSDAINHGVDPLSLGAGIYPAAEYLHPADSVLRFASGVLDAGAYEFESPLALDDPVRQTIQQLYPEVEAYYDPETAQLLITIPESFTELRFALVSMTGIACRQWRLTSATHELSIRALPSGSYILLLESKHGLLTALRFVKAD